MPPEGYPFPYVYPPMSYMPAPADGQPHPEGAPNGAPPPMAHPFYPTYPAIYPHPYGAYPGAPPMGYPPLVPAPMSASPPSVSAVAANNKPDGVAGPTQTPPLVNGTDSGAGTGTGTGKTKKRSRAKSGDEPGRTGKKAKDVAPEVNGDAGANAAGVVVAGAPVPAGSGTVAPSAVEKDAGPTTSPASAPAPPPPPSSVAPAQTQSQTQTQAPPQPQPQQQQVPPPPPPPYGGQLESGPVSAFSGPEPRPLMAAM